jgi:hypothetical protein
MIKKNKIIEDLIGKLFIKENKTKDDVYKETNLILGYLNKTLDENEIKDVEDKIANDDDFRFSLDLIRYELTQNNPKYSIVLFFAKSKAFISHLIGSFNAFRSNAPTAVSNDYSVISGSNNFQIKYLIPISLSATAILVFSLMLNAPTYSFLQLSSSRSLYFDTTWRGEEDSIAKDNQKILINYEKEKLTLEWTNTNRNTNNYLLRINQEPFNIGKNPSFDIENYKFDNDTLYIEIIEYFDKEPISKFNGVYLIRK